MNTNGSETIFVGDSEMAGLMRSHDWSQTSLGAVETWPQSLRSTLSICLNSRFPIAIYWGPDCLLLYNDAWRPIVGDKHPWALGRPGREVWSEIWDDIGAELASVLATGEGTFHKDDLLSMHRFGYTEECFFEYTFNPIQGEGGVVEGVFNVVTETTYRVLNERRAQLLREVAAKTGIAKTAEELCALMIEAFESDPLDIPAALLYLIDQDGQYAHRCDSTKWAPNHSVCPARINLMDENSPDDWLIIQAVQTAQSQVITDLLTRFGVLSVSSWPEHPQEAIVLPIAATNQSRVTGVLVAIASPRRRLDESYCDFLNQVAGQIALAIANARAYEEERKRAERLAELDQAKTTFFSNVSHEFRTPLTLMLNPLESVLASSDSLSPSDREQLEIAYRNSQRLLKLVNTLLDFSRIEAGRIQAVYEPTDLARLTADLAGVFRSAIERAGMRLQVDCPSLPEPVYVDREMWEKIVLNLLSNAFKFTFEGEIAVSLRAVDHQIELEVRDTGTGIPAEELPHIFERFHRVKGARGRSYEGSGIGLALVQELVNLHSGSIRVNSAVEQGTCFTVTIPVGYAHLPSERIGVTRTLASTATGAMPYVEEMLRWSSTSSESSDARASELSRSIPVQPQSSSTPTARILLADDNADMRDYLQRLLSQPYQVETVANGVAALAAIRQQIPDLVLTDVMMPEMDGFELLQSLRSEPTTQDIPIILLSARAGEEARIEGLEIGSDDYLTKPFSARELLARVEANLKLAQLRREATQREQALRLEAEAAQQKVETILSSISDAFVVLDRDWYFTYVNDRYCEIVDREQEALVGQNAWELFPETVNSEAYRQFQWALSQQTLVEFEWLFPDWNRWFEYRVYPSADGLAIFVTEITERKRIEAERRQAEAALRQSEERYRTLFESIDEGFCIIEVLFDENNTPVDYRFLEINSTFEQQTGLQQAIGKTARQLVPDLEDFWFETYGRVALTGEPVRFEHSSVPMNRWFDVYACRMGEPETRKVAIVFKDITERKQAEVEREQLLHQEQILRQQAETAECRLYALLASIHEDFVWFDHDWYVIYLNPQAATTMQKSRDEILGRCFWDLFPDLVGTEFYDRLHQVVREQTPMQFEYLYNSWDVWFENRAYPTTEGLIILCTNITDRKQAEAEREQLLAQEQAAREAAEAANRIKDEFLAVVSHELRSPLNPILGWSKLLRSRQLDEQKTDRALEVIERNAHIQAQLINDLLDVSRILRGKLSLDIRPVNLVTIIQAALETVRLAAEAKSIQIDTQLEPNVGQVAGDTGRLQQVVWNLLSNAVKFTAEGGRVDIRLERIDSQAQITVTDSGKGIPADFLPYVFDQFRQESSATTRRFGGLGLGLAIVRYLVELHGGTVQADSPGEGQGATFTIKLSTMQHQPMVNQKPRPSKSSVNLQGIRILVVDDDDSTLEFLIFLLELHGANVLAATTASEALTALTQFQPSVLLSDIGMPDVDGYMLLRQIRTLPAEQGGTIPAIALTAYAGEIDYQQAMAAGFQRHIVKPIEPEVLIQAISELQE
jgi:PAS domain S-box-containing protein